jgi:manganese/zinc/iron transport system permease protein
MNAFWIILTGTLVSAICGILGCFLILRKMSMLGDAISHAVLPGIVIAYFIAGERASLPILIGAAALGMLVTIMIEGLQKNGHLQVDASIGVSFTSLFALGIILVSLFAGQIDIDADCVLHGEMAYVPLDTLYLNDVDLGPRPIWILGVSLLVVLFFVWRGYKGLYLTTFDMGYAATLGVSVAFWHYGLMAAVSLSTVVSFESVGAIIVVAFLVVPPATAYLVSDKLTTMIGLTLLAGLTSSVGGYFLARSMDGSIAGAMSVVAGLQFAITLLFTKNKKRLEQKGIVLRNPFRVSSGMAR